MDRGIKNLFRRSLFDDLAGSHHIHSGAQCCNDPISWLTTRREVPVSFTILFRRWRIWTWTAASSAVVGSSAIMTRGSQARAMAMAAPLAHPPGKLEGILSHPKLRSADPRHIQQLFRPLLSLPPGTFSMGADGLRDLASDLYRGVRQFIESWRIMAISCPGFTGLSQTVIPSDETSALSPEKPHHCQHRRALSRAGFSHDTGDFALPPQKSLSYRALFFSHIRYDIVHLSFLPLKCSFVFSSPELSLHRRTH